ncbi:RNA-binding protein MEX3B [Camponotus floridanus]|uniref:RNA-binding protein MEX3B n=1 Tax=Camponotus floridanus TaxID=104421 RepID=E2AQ94_CAMFO|nr:RNA-binding protein MEX3B [Camponotus floridanus]
MPTSLFCEMDRSSNGSSTGASFEDQRAFQLALELSMLGLSENSSGCPGVGTGNGTTNDPDPLQTTPAVFEEARSKKSQNMTECVPVPSSEHVAEIVGRQDKRAVSKRAFVIVAETGISFLGAFSKPRRDAK